MNLKNYTSEVPAESSVARIEKMLVDAGASGIAKEYEDGVPSSLIFKIAFDPSSLPLTIKLPANVKACHQAMWQEHCRSRSHRSRKTDKDFLPQARRTAWRIMQDWVEVQVSLMRLKQMDTIQAFLPYVYDGKQTVYELVREGGFKALTAPGT